MNFAPSPGSRGAVGKAEPGTIRALHGTSIERNAIHGSDSPENARLEVAFFFAAHELLGGESGALPAGRRAGPPGRGAGGAGAGREGRADRQGNVKE